MFRPQTLATCLCLLVACNAEGEYALDAPRCVPACTDGMQCDEARGVCMRPVPQVIAAEEAEEAAKQPEKITPPWLKAPPTGAMTEKGMRLFFAQDSGPDFEAALRKASERLVDLLVVLAKHAGVPQPEVAGDWQKDGKLFRRVTREIAVTGLMPVTQWTEPDAVHALVVWELEDAQRSVERLTDDPDLRLKVMDNLRASYQNLAASPGVGESAVFTKGDAWTTRVFSRDLTSVFATGKATGSKDRKRDRQADDNAVLLMSRYLCTRMLWEDVADNARARRDPNQLRSETRYDTSAQTDDIAVVRRTSLGDASWSLAALELDTRERQRLGWWADCYPKERRVLKRGKSKKKTTAKKKRKKRKKRGK